jgi:hypothetical protein
MGPDLIVEKLVCEEEQQNFFRVNQYVSLY